jgi:hypothetical protein
MDSEVTTGGGGGFEPFPLQTSVLCWTTKEEELIFVPRIFLTLIFICRLLLRHIFSFRAFSYDACFHYASSPTTLNFIRAFSYNA